MYLGWDLAQNRRCPNSIFYLKLISFKIFICIVYLNVIWLALNNKLLILKQIDFIFILFYFVILK